MWSAFKSVLDPNFYSRCKISVLAFPWETKPPQVLPPDFCFLLCHFTVSENSHYDDYTYGVPSTSNIDALSVSSLLCKSKQGHNFQKLIVTCLLEKLCFTNKSFLNSQTPCNMIAQLINRRFEKEKKIGWGYGETNQN